MVKYAKNLSGKQRGNIVRQAKKGKDFGKHGKTFNSIAAKAAKRYGSKAAGRRVAGAIFWKQRSKGR